MAKFAGMWYGKMTRLERLSVQSFIDNGHEYHLYLYDMENAKKISNKVFIHDANEIYPESKIFKNKDNINPFSQFADIFRIELLSQQDIIWSDLDNICLSKEWQWNDFFIPQMPRKKEDPNQTIYFNNSLIKIKMNSSLMKFLLNECRSFDVKNSQSRFDLSVPLLTNYINYNYQECKKYLIPSNVTFPIHYDDIKIIYDKKQLLGSSLLTRQSFAIHLWRETLIQSNLIDQIPEKDSWLYNIYQKHMPYSSQLDWNNL